MGFGGDEQVAHGFRSVASTMLNESGRWNPDVIELALGHVDGNRVRGIYNRAAYRTEYAEMLQAWADELDRIREGGAVVKLQRHRR
jgi:integrase